MPQIPFDPYDFFGYLASGLLVVIGMQFTFGFPQILDRDLKAANLAILVLAVYVAGQMAAAPAKALLEDTIVDKILHRPNINLFRERKPRVRALLFPGFYKPLPPAIRRKILSKAESQGITGTGETLFLYVRYSADVLQDPTLIGKLNSFINKYGFARNLAFTSLCVGLAVMLKTRASPESELTKYAATALISSVFLFYRYLKFFRQYSYEMFNTYGLK
jgi:hypothetical protein